MTKIYLKNMVIILERVFNKINMNERSDIK
jgi:hypothetical protein